MRIVKLRSWSGQSQTVRVRISTNGSWLNEPKRLLDAIDYCQAPGPGHVLVKVQVKVPVLNKLKIEFSESKIGTWRDTIIKCATATHPPPTKLF